jgi:hypothetical protein
MLELPPLLRNIDIKLAGGATFAPDLRRTARSAREPITA